MPTIVTQIEKLERDLQDCRKKQDEIDRKLRSEENTTEERGGLSEQYKLLGTEVEGYEEELKHLRKENMKTMFVAVAIGLFAYLCYSTCSVFWSSESAQS